MTSRVVATDAMDMLSLSILVLFVGFMLNGRIRVLADNYIPPAGTGGVLFSLISWFLYASFDVELDFDMRIRDLLLLVFFSTVGLSARLSALANGGKALAVLVADDQFLHRCHSGPSPMRTGCA